MNHKHRLTVAVYEALRNPDGVVFSAGFDGIDGLFKTMWKNTSLTAGMALTDVGLGYLIKLLELEHWTFAAPGIVSADLVMMERYMTTPYHLVPQRNKDQKNLVLFDSSTASQLLLYGSDLKQFLRAHDTASKRPVTKQHTTGLQ